MIVTALVSIPEYPNVPSLSAVFQGNFSMHMKIATKAAAAVTA